jgi:hypothetical protein
MKFDKKTNKKNLEQFLKEKGLMLVSSDFGPVNEPTEEDRKTYERNLNEFIKSIKKAAPSESGPR